MPGTDEITQVGKREDLADLIAVADAKQTPFSSMVRKGPNPKNSEVSWLVDGYDDPKTDGVVDGKDVSSYEDAAAQRARLYGRVQMWERVPKVSTLAERLSHVAGVNNPKFNNPAGATEFKRAKAKKLIELKRDKEATYLSTNESQDDNGTLPYKTRGLGKWLQSSAQSHLAVPSEYRTPATSIFGDSISDFTEESLNALLKSRWDETGTADELVGFVGSDIKQAISDFTRYAPEKDDLVSVRTYNANVESGKVRTTVDIYEGDFGSLKLVLAPFVPTTRTGYLLDMRMVEERPLIAGEIEPLPDLGGGPRAIIRAIACLAVLNPLAHAKIDALAPTPSPSVSST